ncbi:MAG: hypothetical protein KJ000_09150 [Pirellulaceae bacterium]|nr:hypothetical protein [Pirellulaceae bacterium]
MKHSLPILIAAAVLASAGEAVKSELSASAASDAQVSGGEFVRRAAQTLGTRPVYQAQLRQHIDLFGQRLSGSGAYLQKSSPRGLLIRLDWDVPVGDRVASVQQISDGRFLWIRRNLLDEPILQRVDLDRVRAAVKLDEPDSVRPSLMADLAILGLPSLLENLAASCRFDSPRAATLGTLPVWVVEGTCNPQKTPNSTVIATEKPKSAKAGSMSQLPTNIRIAFDKQDLLLRRIEYLRREESEISKSSENVEVELRLLAMIEVIRVSDGEMPDDRLFICEPGNLEIVDHTDRYLRAMTNRWVD